MSKLYKILSAAGRSCHGGDFEWSLPRGSRPGKWTPWVDVEPCKSGYHLCRPCDLASWIGARVWVAEARGGIVVHTSCDGVGKVVAESVRLVAPTAWDDRTARLFAADCAARVSHLLTDDRSRAAIVAARAFARGEIGDAARDAAWDAARDAARDAAGDAARDAARDAAWDAARDAARDAAWAAAWAAAGAAAWAAAGAAARDAAGAAAWGAARAWQSKRIHRYVLGLPCRDVPVAEGSGG